MDNSVRCAGTPFFRSETSQISIRPAFVAIARASPVALKTASFTPASIEVNERINRRRGRL